jgi:hypothetical protein
VIGSLSVSAPALPSLNAMNPGNCFVPSHNDIAERGGATVLAVLGASLFEAQLESKT